MTYAQAEALLLALPRFTEVGAAAVKPGLERMEALMEGMGRPHERYESVHVAGTNGKGSTASMLAAIGTAAGWRVGLHTSPHLHTLRERMRLDGAPAPEAWVADAVARHRGLLARVRPSFFEATAALSLLYFAEAGADLAVVEVGLGGRLDATNILTPRVALVTAIAMDHADLLGGTLEAIAREKAGIAKGGVPLLTAAEGGGVRTALWEETAARGGVFEQVQNDVHLLAAEDTPEGLRLDLLTPLRPYIGLEIGLPGRHQAWNAVLAVRAAERLLPEVRASEGPVREGLRNVRNLSGLAGRCETLLQDPLVLADVAHNADGLAAALAAARTRTAGRLSVLLGVMQDKDTEALADLLARDGATVLPVTLPTPRALPPGTLRAVLLERGVNVGEGESVQEGLSAFFRVARRGDTLLVTGSHVTVAAARDALSELSRTWRAALP